MAKVPKEVSDYMAMIGGKGGKAGKGKSKRRGSKGCYAAISRKRWNSKVTTEEESK